MTSPIDDVIGWARRLLESTAPDADPSQVYTVADARIGLRVALELYETSLPSRAPGAP